MRSQILRVFLRGFCIFGNVLPYNLTFNQKTLDFFIYFLSVQTVACTHLLANSKVLDLFDAPFQSYDVFLSMLFLILI